MQNPLSTNIFFKKLSWQLWMRYEKINTKIILSGQVKNQCIMI